MSKHADQRDLWDTEHAKPSMHPAMDSTEPSGAIAWLLMQLDERGADLGEMTGLEFGCGKGRNAIFLAKKGVTMTGFDFSKVAIGEAKKRSETDDIAINWKVADATKDWPFENESFDLGIDCYGSTDLDSPGARAHVRAEWKRVLKPGGYLLVAAISDKSPYHADMIAKHPGSEEGSFVYPSGKYEKTFAEEELWELYEDFELLTSTVSKGKATFSGREAKTENYWMLFGI